MSLGIDRWAKGAGGGVSGLAPSMHVVRMLGGHTGLDIIHHRLGLLARARERASRAVGKVYITDVQRPTLLGLGQMRSIRSSIDRHDLNQKYNVGCSI